MASSDCLSGRPTPSALVVLTCLGTRVCLMTASDICAVVQLADSRSLVPDLLAWIRVRDERLLAGRWMLRPQLHGSLLAHDKLRARRVDEVLHRCGVSERQSDHQMVRSRRLLLFVRPRSIESMLTDV